MPIYATNSEELNKFWAEGIERTKGYESIITLVMRGDGDLPMSESANISLLEKIVADQRSIIASHEKKDVRVVPQDWALYLPTPEERHRSGGAGIHYHFDYVGDPRSYMWLNTAPITRSGSR